MHIYYTLNIASVYRESSRPSNTELGNAFISSYCTTIVPENPSIHINTVPGDFGFRVIFEWNWTKSLNWLHRHVGYSLIYFNIFKLLLSYTIFVWYVYYVIILGISYLTPHITENTYQPKHRAKHDQVEWIDYNRVYGINQFN